MTDSLTEKDLEDRQTDIFTLVIRIRRAFFEGAAVAGIVDREVAQQAWLRSEAFRIYQILLNQAMEQ